MKVLCACGTMWCYNTKNYFIYVWKLPAVFFLSGTGVSCSLKKTWINQLVSIDLSFLWKVKVNLITHCDITEWWCRWQDELRASVINGTLLRSKLVHFLLFPVFITELYSRCIKCLYHWNDTAEHISRAKCTERIWGSDWIGTNTSTSVHVHDQHERADRLGWIKGLYYSRPRHVVLDHLDGGNSFSGGLKIYQSCRPTHLSQHPSDSFLSSTSTF